MIFCAGRVRAEAYFRAYIIIFVLLQWVESEVDQYSQGNIVPGTGYSSDKQQVVQQKCYNLIISSTSAEQGYVRLDTALSALELENTLGISLAIGRKFWMFSGEASANYVRSIQDKDYSLSLNYYQYTANNVALQLEGYGVEALTETAKLIYNNGKNPRFGLLCGDHYIDSYQQGAFLTMSLNIKFSSSEAKKQFVETSGIGFAGIISASERIESVVRRYKINGTASVQAFQIGGEPNELAKVLNKDTSGQYYALTCSLATMANCTKVASGLLDYARDNFSKQFSFKNNTGLTPLGLAFTHYNPIDYIGLNVPVSLVTREVLQYRQELADKLRENEYYQQKFYPFFNRGYPVKLSGTFIEKAHSVLSRAKNNIAVLMQAHGGAADCFDFPDNCGITRAGINSQLKNITINDLTFLEALKYTVTTVGGVFYNSGGETLWSPVPNNKPGEEKLTLVLELNITDENYSYVTRVDSPKHPPIGFSYVGILDASRMCYVGELCNFITEKHCLKNYQECKLISPFYFEVFSENAIV